MTRNQYFAFKDFVADDIDQLYQAIKDIGFISEKKFKRVYQQLDTNHEGSISDDQFRLLFKVMDTNGDARVSFDEFSSLLQNAHKMGRSIEKNVDRPFNLGPQTQCRPNHRAEGSLLELGQQSTAHLGNHQGISPSCSFV